jgi:hypothetical protein
MKHHRMDHGSVTIALRNIFTHDFDKPAQPHYDLIHSCRLLIEQSPANWLSRHVRGHQDDHMAYAELDKWEQTNVDMDTLAKFHWQTVVNSRHPHFDLQPTTDWSVWHRNR